MFKTDHTATTYSKPLLSPRALKQELPATDKHDRFIQESRQQIRNILRDEDRRLLLIVGPCSIHDLASAKEYAIKLRHLADQLKSFLIVMRTYFEKPRTVSGWKGLLNDPHIDNSFDIDTGLRWSRQLLLFLADLGMPAATEFLDPLTPYYLGDLISWGCIGARTSESQTHRQCASGLPMPVAFKNSTSGNVDIAINGIIAANLPQSFFGMDNEGNIAKINTPGNPDAHIALRGGDSKPNYDAESLAHAVERLKKHQLPSRMIIDCSHSNSSRNYRKQIDVFKSVIDQYAQGNTAIKGLALESNLHAGRQSLPLDQSPLHYGVSITDPCLDWAATEELLHLSHSLLEKEPSSLNFSGLG